MVLGWTEDEIRAKVIPVIQIWLPFLSGDSKRGELTQQQRRIDSFYHTYHDNTRVAKIQSSRLREAVQNKKTPKAVRSSTRKSDKKEDEEDGQSKQSGAKRSRRTMTRSSDDCDDDFVPNFEPRKTKKT